MANRTSYQRRNFTLPPGDAERLDDLSDIARYGSKSHIVAMGLGYVWTARQAAAIADLQIAAAAAYGRDAAFVITGSGERSLKLGQLKYDRHGVVTDEEGRVEFVNDRAPAWNFEDAGWDTYLGRNHSTTWDLRIVRPTSQAGDLHTTMVGIQITSGQGTSPLGHLPLIVVADGTHVADRYEDRAVLPVWDWGHRSLLADSDGREIVSVLPPLHA